MSRFDLIAVQIGDQRKIYMAPRLSHIQIGDEVVVDSGIKVDGFELAVGKVIETLTFVDDDEHSVEFSLALANQTRPIPRIKKHVKYIDLNYEEE